MPKGMQQEVQSIIAQFEGQVSTAVAQWTQARDPAAFIDVEQAAHALGRQLADDLVAVVLRQILDDPAFIADCVSKAIGTGQFRCNCRRTATVTLLGGTTHEVEATPYMIGVKRHGRKKPLAGVFPCLAALGITEHCSPALVSEVCRQDTESCSFRDALATLARRGICLEYKRALALVRLFGKEAVAQRTQWADLARQTEPVAGPLKGRDVLVCIDGGRLRERQPKPGRRTKRRHHRYETPWREPRQLVISVLDGSGRPDPRFAPIYDGSVADADELFLLLWSYLQALGGRQAKRIIFAADGAEWIWRRTWLLRIALTLPSDRFIEVVDWPHAVGMLGTIAKHCTGWSERRQQRWIEKLKPALYNGDIATVVAEIRQLARGRRAKKVLSHLDFFEGNAARMQYRSFRARKLPIGSGVVESAIRRVINLRLKSPGKFWLHDNAEAVLHLRSYLKAGHWDQLALRTLRGRIPWNDVTNDFLPELRKAA
jgi:hypothetical protein